MSTHSTLHTLESSAPDHAASPAAVPSLGGTWFICPPSFLPLSRSWETSASHSSGWTLIRRSYVSADQARADLEAELAQFIADMGGAL